MVDEHQVQWSSVPKSLLRWIGECIAWPFKHAGEHLFIEAIVTLAFVAYAIIKALQSDGKSLGDAVVDGLLGGIVAIVLIYVVYLILAPSQITEKNRFRIAKLECELKAKNKRVDFYRKSLLAIVNVIKSFNSAGFGTFGPPLHALQESGLSLILASHKQGHMIVRQFRTDLMYPNFNSSAQQEFTHAMGKSELEFERIAEEITKNDILPEFNIITWITESLKKISEQGKVILSDYSDENDINWISARDKWSGNTRRWIEIFISKNAANEHMQGIDHKTKRGCLESHLHNLDRLTNSITSKLLVS